MFIFCASLFAQGDLPFQGLINGEGVNIRSDATINSIIICNGAKDERVEVVLERYGWYKVRLPESCPCYIRTDMVECISLPGGTCRSAKVVRERVNIRLKPKEDSAVVGNTGKNEIISIKAQIGNWYRIAPTVNSFGWINKKLITKAPVNLAPPAEIKETPSILPPEEPKEEKPITIEGMVEPYGMVLGRVATHKLKTADGNTYLLKGNKKILDTVNYQRIRIEGMVLERKAKKIPLIEIRKMEVLD